MEEKGIELRSRPSGHHVDVLDDDDRHVLDSTLQSNITYLWNFSQRTGWRNWIKRALAGGILRVVVLISILIWALNFQVAKMLAFASSAGSVAWNKFSGIWLLSVGLSPTEAGLLKSVGDQSLFKSKATRCSRWHCLGRPIGQNWSTADVGSNSWYGTARHVMLTFYDKTVADGMLNVSAARLHPGLRPVSMHSTAAFSIILSIFVLEALRRWCGLAPFPQKRIVVDSKRCCRYAWPLPCIDCYAHGVANVRRREVAAAAAAAAAAGRYAGELPFGYVLALRTAWSVTNAGCPRRPAPPRPATPRQHPATPLSPPTSQALVSPSGRVDQPACCIRPFPLRALAYNRSQP